MRAVITHLVLAAAGMTFWAWAVFEAQAHFIHLAALSVVMVLAFSLEPSRSHHDRTRKGKTVKKLWVWGCLTTAAVLALTLGERRASESAVLDPNSPAGAR